MGVRGLPSGFVSRTRTRSPTRKRGVISGAGVLTSALTLGEGCWIKGWGNADETVDGHQSRQSFLAPTLRTLRPTRQHHPAYVARAIVNAHLDTVGQAQIEPFRQRAPRVAHDATL